MTEAMRKVMTSACSEKVKQASYLSEESSERPTQALNRMPSRFACPVCWRNKFPFGNSKIIYHKIATQMIIKTEINIHGSRHSEREAV